MFTNFEALASNPKEENQHYNVIKFIAPNIIEKENEETSRRDCIVAVMRLVGVDDMTANSYADMDYDQPVFLDVNGNEKNDGYIFIAKFSNVATGVDFYPNGVNNFAPTRDVTVKECLAFMLRCLTDIESVSWDGVMDDSVKAGLLHEDELEMFIADDALQNKQFYTLLNRMLDKNRYLYWPTENPRPGYAKSMQIDRTNSIRYIDWILEKRNDDEKIIKQ
jgi:hypothetical protein